MEHMRLPLSSDGHVALSEAIGRAFWAQLAAAAAAASLSPAANATTVASVYYSFGLHSQADDLTAEKMIEISMERTASKHACYLRRSV